MQSDYLAPRLSIMAMTRTDFLRWQEQEGITDLQDTAFCSYESAIIFNPVTTKRVCVACCLLAILFCLLFTKGLRTITLECTTSAYILFCSEGT